jgi:hypothetical protein
MKKLTQEEFLAKAVAVHGVGRYDYSQAVYISKEAKVTVVCKLHGPFEQNTKSHLSGAGCEKCARIHHNERVVAYSAKQKQDAANQYVNKARAVHGDKYDYSQVVYSGSNGKVIILCPAHGPFEQVAAAHLRGQNCPNCADVTLNNNIFIERASLIHGSKYDYSLASYIIGTKKVAIVCPTHGVFEQRPASHLNGSGCHACALERTKQGWIERAEGHNCILYLMRFFSEDEEFFKVGITYRTIKQRFVNIKSRVYQLEVIAEFSSRDASRIFSWEESILATFAHLRYTPKHRFDGSFECFSSCEEILAIFPL